VARELGWPNNPIGWQEIQEKATDDPNFKWNHSATNNASGLLATLAEFYAGAGLTRGLTIEAATRQSTLDYVQAVESTVRFYGEGEEVIVERLAEEGRNFLDAFVAQERVVIDWNNRNPSNPLVAIYPAEGTLWTDHPLALLELGTQPHELAVTDNQRLTYQAFADFLLSPNTQKRFLALGYRPADLSIELDAGESPFANSAYVDWRQPQTTLQMPAPSVIQVVRNVWYYTKRPTNVYLVVDTSGSMEGNKIVRAREALVAFVQQIQGDRDRLGLVEFASGTKNFLPLRVMDDSNRRDTINVINEMDAYGGTALVDAVYAAVTDIAAQEDTGAINAIVVMTDGQENESYYRLRDLEMLLNSSGSARPVIFTIAFGNDADEPLLTEMARIGQGQFRRADETDIEELYRIISTYF
jgi:Ca-activated chloride channel family protein